jgi:GAF domain-containing protein
VRQLGGEQALLSRISEFSPLIRAAFRANRAVVVPDASTDSRVLSDERWKTIGITPRSVICAPVQAIGCFLGLVEIANPLDGGSYTSEDGNALTYIGQQLAEFIAAREVVIDPERVMKDAQKGQRR